MVQLENLKHYKFIKELLDTKRMEPYAMWLDIYCGDIHVFNFKEKRYIRLNESNYDKLVSSLNQVKA